MKKYILTAVFLGLLVTLFYYPTPATVLEQNNDTPPSVAPESEEVIADSKTANYSMHTKEIFVEEDPNSQSVVLSIQ